jgi:arylsulfatase A-like enzyme
MGPDEECLQMTDRWIRARKRQGFSGLPTTDSCGGNVYSQSAARQATRHFCRKALERGGLMILFLILAAVPVRATGPSRPNIVVIVADDLGFSDLGCYGGEIETPRLDSLAAAGIRCTQMYSAARCCPSRASLLTGLYPHQAGVGFMVYHDWGRGYEGTLNERCVTFAEVLQQAGYQTFASGKWHVSAHRNPPASSLPENRGFDRSTVVRTHVDSYWKVLEGCDVYRDGQLLIAGDNDQAEIKNPYQPSRDFYTTEYFTDVALEYLAEAAEEPDRPFLLYLAYNAPHFPLEAPDDVIAEYEARFSDPDWRATWGTGWDDMRARKLDRQKMMGLVPSDQTLPAVRSFRNVTIMPGLQKGVSGETIPAWDDLPAAVRQESIFRRSIYNAQVEVMDTNIGRVVDTLTAQGNLEDTIIFFVSDNGCSGEMGVFGTHFEGGRYDCSKGRFEAGEFLPGGVQETDAWSRKDRLGGVGYSRSNYSQWKKFSGWATSQGQGWAAYSNTPFRKFKKFVHEGGIASPLIVHWPQRLAASGGSINRTAFHFVDVMPTLLDLANASYPEEYRGKPRQPLEGVSMLPYLLHPEQPPPDRCLFWQHETHAAVRQGTWKAITDNDRAQPIEWELYDLSADRSETKDLVRRHPEIIEKLFEKWRTHATRVNVTPVPERRNRPVLRASVSSADANVLLADRQPATSSDIRVPRLSFHPKRGTVEWVELDFPQPEQIESLAVYWFDEAQAAASFRNEHKEVLPKSWRLLHREGDNWRGVTIVEKQPGVERDKFNRVTLAQPIMTCRLRIEVELHKDLSAGILACRLNPPLPAPPSQPKEDVEEELQRVKKEAQQTLCVDVDEFNGYPHLNGNRPEFDGWLNKTNNKEFLQQNIPKFLCSDEDFTEVFNYRWWMITKHLKQWEEDGKRFFVFTEFPGFPGWAADSGAIPAPAGHQFYDLRWLRDPKFLRSYAGYWLTGPPARTMQAQNNTWLSTLPRPQSHHYTSWMVDAAEAFLEVHPDGAWLDQMLPAMETHQAIWDRIFRVDAPDAVTDGLYKCLDMYDANEFTLSTTLGLIASQGSFAEYTAAINDDPPYRGQERWRRYFTDGKGWQAAFEAGLRNNPLVYPQAFDLENYRTVPQAFGGNHDWYLDRDGHRREKNPVSYPNCFTVRPSLNCYMYGNYAALASLYLLRAADTGSLTAQASAAEYANRANDLQDRILRVLWHQPAAGDQYQFYEKRGNCADPFFFSRLAGDNVHTGGVVDTLSVVRETVGYTPWYFQLLPVDDVRYDIAWKQFDDRMGFRQPFGMSTAEYRHDFFNEMSYGWNGRGWPFQNSVVYKAYANYLRNYKTERGGITESDRALLFDHIRQYVELHGRRRSIGEWYLPRTGGYRMPGGGEVVQSLPAMGKGFGDVQDYFHSTFPDMLIADLIGVQASHSNRLTIHPLLPKEAWEFFYLGELRYHGHEIDLLWKRDWLSDEPGDQSRLLVWVDGKIAAAGDDLRKPLEIVLP